jgi:metal-responsive CopG/Arc/MetJ family transcriptional regulator
MSRIRTINLYNWQLEAIAELDYNRSRFIRIALKEQLDYDRKQGLLKIPGVKITTVNMGDELYKDFDALNNNHLIISCSEYLRTAVRNRILRERKERIVEAFRESLPDDMVYIPSMNGGLPFKTKRLEL